jgi:hypothetical protein
MSEPSGCGRKSRTPVPPLCCDAGLPQQDLHRWAQAGVAQSCTESAQRMPPTPSHRGRAEAHRGSPRAASVPAKGHVKQIPATTSGCDPHTWL